MYRREDHPTPVSSFHHPSPITVSTLLLGLLALVLVQVAPALAAESLPVRGGESAITITPARPPSAPLLQAMHHWHAQYLSATQEVRRGASWVSRVLTQKYPKLDRPCRYLGAALAQHEIDRLFPVPDSAADRHLRSAFGALGKAVRACHAGRPTELIWELQQARSAFAHAELALRRYQLKP